MSFRLKVKQTPSVALALKIGNYNQGNKSIFAVLGYDNVRVYMS